MAKTYTAYFIGIHSVYLPDYAPPFDMKICAFPREQNDAEDLQYLYVVVHFLRKYMYIHAVNQKVL